MSRAREVCFFPSIKIMWISSGRSAGAYKGEHGQGSRGRDDEDRILDRRISSWEGAGHSLRAERKARLCSPFFPSRPLRTITDTASLRRFAPSTWFSSSTWRTRRWKNGSSGAPPSLNGRTTTRRRSTRESRYSTLRTMRSSIITRTKSSGWVSRGKFLCAFAFIFTSSAYPDDYIFRFRSTRRER